MASMHISHTSDILNRCSIKNGLFDSSKLQNIKKNILLEISSKWETFSDSTKPVDVPAISSVNRKPKIRSVYGQPEVLLEEQASGLQSSHWRSLDSLDTYDSGHGLGSNSTSCSDLRVAGSTKPADAGVSDLGTSVESFDNELESYSKRCRSCTSTSSGCSISSQEDEAKFFMKQFVCKIFSNSASISLEEKANFGLFARSESGRLWFARNITKKRNENKRVSESTFYSLAQYFAIVLFECAEADHFTPAKSLMNMCFTYYHQISSRPWSANSSVTANRSSSKQYLCSVLRDQPIWRSLRFWNAAFFDVVQTERVTFFESRQRPMMSKQDALDDWQFQANVTFGQLGTFTYQMHSFGLPIELCMEFFHKQSTIANLTTEQIQLLQENIEAMYGCGAY